MLTGNSFCTAKRISTAVLFAAASFFSLEAVAETAPGSALNLSNGSSLLGWSPTGTWSPAGGVIATSGSGNRTLFTAVPFGEITLVFDYNVSAPINSALHLWADKDGNGGLRIDLDNSGAPWGVGGIEQMSHSKIASVSEGWHHIQIDASGGHITVLLDGKEVSNASNVGSRAGYLGFEATGDGNLQIRQPRVVPQNLRVNFNGADLSGWKSIAHNPVPGNGFGHTMAKTFSFGMSGKPHSANWTVRGKTIHGESGPGGLENASMYDDLVLHLSAVIKGGPVKKENFTGIYLRNTAGQLAGGYPVGIGAYSGQVEGLVSHASAGESAPIDETVILAGRTVAIWIGSNLTTVYTDPRPESGTATGGAKTSSGAMTIVLPNDRQTVDIQHLAVAALPGSYGLAARSAPPAPPAPPPVVAQAPASPAESVAQTAILQQQQATAKQAADAKADKLHVATLMSQALSTADPQQQMSLYSQVVHIDPSNAAAVQGFKEAQAKVEAQQANQQKAATAEVDQQKAEVSREQQTLASLSQAQASFLGGHLSQANTSLAVAERLAPDNPLVRDLRSRINSATSLRSRLYFLGGGAGVLGLAGIFALWMRRRRQQKHPVFELIRGLDSGRRYPLDKDLIRIGAVAQDGGQKNDIVVRDVEHAVSRFHCEVRKDNGQLYITDLNSSNGTRIDGQVLEPGKPILLRRGAKLDLGGSVELQFGYDRRPKKNT